MIRTARHHTVEWLDGPIRICTFGHDGHQKPLMAWAPWDDKWPRDQRLRIDRALVYAVKKKR